MAIRTRASEISFANLRTQWKGQTASSRTWQLVDSLWVVILGLATFLARLPFQATLLNNFDAFNYALALHQFDMRLSQPQAPGYPLYELLGWLFKLVLRDDRIALVSLSMLASGLAAIGIYLAGRELFDRRVGLIGALFLSVSAVFWYMGEIASPYALDLLASVVVGWLCYRLLTSPDRRLVWLSGLAIGLAGALRLQTLLFLFPMYLYSLYAGLYRPGERRTYTMIAESIGLALGVFAVFFVPAVWLSGGPAGFLRSMQSVLPIFRDANTLVRTTRIVRFTANAATMLRYTYRTIGELVLPFLLVGYLAQENWLRFWRNPKLIFLLLWMLPAWFTYLLIWPGNLGTMLVSMPPLFLLASAGLSWVMSRGRSGAALGGVALLVILVWSVVVFAWLPAAPFGASYRHFDNYADLQDSVAYYRTKLSLVSQLPAQSTVVVTDDFRAVQYYLPDYHVLTIPHFQTDNGEVVKSVISIQYGNAQSWKGIEGVSLIPKGTRYVVLFDAGARLDLSEPLIVEDQSGEGYGIGVIAIPAGRQVSWTSRGLSLIPPIQ